jgi:hypothetical protein
MTTHITLEDGRVFGTSNGVYDEIIEWAAREMEKRPEGVEGLREWLLDQRCKVQGPGVGYLDLRELCSEAASEFRSAAIAGFKTLQEEGSSLPWAGRYSLLVKMWESIDRNEPPEALTCEWYLMSPYRGTRRGPGWSEQNDA